MRDGKLEPKQEDGSDPIFFFSHIKKKLLLEHSGQLYHLQRRGMDSTS